MNASPFAKHRKLSQQLCILNIVHNIQLFASCLWMTHICIAASKTFSRLSWHQTSLKMHPSFSSGNVGISDLAFSMLVYLLLCFMYLFCFE